LTQAHVEAEAIGSRWQLWQILGALGELESAEGNRSQATQYFAQAHDVIAFIADHAPADLRDSFLNLPHIRSIEKQHVEN
jgi:hypothetical protein